MSCFPLQLLIKIKSQINDFFSKAQRNSAYIIMTACSHEFYCGTSAAAGMVSHLLLFGPSWDSTCKNRAEGVCCIFRKKETKMDGFTL
ncbi:MAG TPA: hypothetical protein DEP27_00505 [Ruminococcaceae bacterium]|nr:hypothetical protein [Oscillospiraceae bacterium]